MRSRCYIQQIVAPTGYNFNQCFYNFFGGFVMIVGNIREGIAHGNAAFPWDIEGMLRDGLLGGDVVFPVARYCSVYDNDAWLVSACHSTYFVHIDVLLDLDGTLPFDVLIDRFNWSHPPAV